MANIDYLSNAGAVRERTVAQIKAKMFEEVETLVELDLALLDPNPFQPRVDFSVVEGIARSLREEGQHYPILVRRVKDRYEVADGETRLRAAKYNREHFPEHPGSKYTVTAVVREYTDEEMAFNAFSTAYQRKSLNPIEEAQGIRRLHTELGFTYAQLAEKLDKTEHYFWERVRLLNLPAKLQDLVGGGQLAASHAINIATFKGPDEKLDVLIEEVLSDKLSVHAIRKRVEALAKEPVEKPAVTDEKELWNTLKGVWKQLGPEARRELVAAAHALEVPATKKARPRKKASPTPAAD